MQETDNVPRKWLMRCAENEWRTNKNGRQEATVCLRALRPLVEANSVAQAFDGNFLVLRRLALFQGLLEGAAIGDTGRL